MNKRRICIECHHAIKNATATQELHKRCSKLRDNRASCAKNKTTTTGSIKHQTVALKLVDASATKRAQRKTSLNFSDIMHAPPAQAIKYLDRILAGESVLTG